MNFWVMESIYLVPIGGYATGFFIYGQHQYQTTKNSSLGDLKKVDPRNKKSQN